MSEKIQNNIVAFPSSETRAKGFKIKAPVKNFMQYVKTVKAYIAASMPVEHIVNAAIVLADPVERAEFDALLKSNWQEKSSEIAECEGEILAWQNRGEIAQVIGQLPSAGGNDGIVLVSRELTDTTQGGNLRVVEGIAVVEDSNSQLNNHDAEIENSLFLKKAA